MGSGDGDVEASGASPMSVKGNPKQSPVERTKSLALSSLAVGQFALTHLTQLWMYIRRRSAQSKGFAFSVAISAVVLLMVLNTLFSSATSESSHFSGITGAIRKHNVKSEAVKTSVLSPKRLSALDKEHRLAEKLASEFEEFDNLKDVVGRSKARSEARRRDYSMTGELEAKLRAIEEERNAKLEALNAHEKRVRGSSVVDQWEVEAEKPDQPFRFSKEEAKRNPDFFAVSGEDPEQLRERLKKLAADVGLDYAKPGGRGGKRKKGGGGGFEGRPAVILPKGDKLLELHVTPGELVPSFDPEVTEYRVVLPPGQEKAAVTVEAEDQRSRVLIDSMPVQFLAKPRQLQEGPNVIPVVVSSWDHAHTRTYTVTVWRHSEGGRGAYDVWLQQIVNRGSQCASSGDCTGGKLCVFGRCKCPVLFAGKARKKGGDGGACAPIKPPEGWCVRPLQTTDPEMLFEAGFEAAGRRDAGDYSREIRLTENEVEMTHYTLNKDNKAGLELSKQHRHRKIQDHDIDDRRSGYDWGICAVVGSGVSVTSKEYGKLIDEHTAVFRVNEAPTFGYEQYVGTKTTLRRQMQERAGFKEGRGDEMCLVETRKFFPARNEYNPCKYVELSPQFEEYSKHYWSVYRPGGSLASKAQSGFSTGFSALVLALHLCGQVNVFGMSDSVEGTYYPKSAAKILPGMEGLKGGLKQNKLEHHLKVERACLSKLGGLPGVNVY